MKERKILAYHSPLFIFICKARQHCSKDPGGVWKHCRTGEAYKFPDQIFFRQQQFTVGRKVRLCKPDPCDCRLLKRHMGGLTVPETRLWILQSILALRLISGCNSKDFAIEFGTHVMRMLIMLPKSTWSGLSVIWPRKSSKSLLHMVDISGLGSASIVKRGSRNSGRNRTVHESGTLSSTLIQETRNWRTNLVVKNIYNKDVERRGYILRCGYVERRGCVKRRGYAF